MEPFVNNKTIRFSNKKLSRYWLKKYLKFIRESSRKKMKRRRANNEKIHR